MKKTLTDIFDEINAKELDVVLDDELNLDPLDDASLKRIQKNVFLKTSLSEPAQKKKTILRKHWKSIATVAACFALLITVGFGTYAYAIETKEYNAAVRFFNDYDLSAEGLSRGEIKAVYRDITTKSFTYSKTAEVIEKSISNNHVDGFEIFQDDPTPEDIENLWNYKNFNGRYWVANSQNTEGINYKYHSDYKLDTKLGFEVHDKSYFEKYQGNNLIWSVSFTEFCINGYANIKDGVIVYGETPTWKSGQTSNAWMTKIDDNGDVVWKRILNNGFSDEYISAILENDDGTYAVISRGDLKYFCLSQYDADGNMTSFNKTEVGNYGIWNAARFNDGYIVQLGSYMTNEHTKIVKVDHTGNITESFSYADKDFYYYITDMIEFDGNIYLSAYSVPKISDEDQSAGGRYEIASVLNYLFDNNIWEISSEELTPMVRANYTAMLLVCNPNVGTPQEFYSVKGSLGGKLALNDSGNLLWDVESITTTFFSPATSAFTIGGTSYVFRYTFDKNGRLMSQEKTGEVMDYRR